MELHIKECIHRNIQKEKIKTITGVLFLILFLFSLIINGILFDYFYVSTLASVCVLLFVFSSKKLVKKNKQITSDLVIIDEQNRFFYQNIIFEMNDLENYVSNKTTISLFFKDFCLVVERNEKLIRYLDHYTYEGDHGNNSKNKNMILLFILLECAFLSLSSFILGGYYCFIEHAQVISYRAVILEIVKIVLVLGSILIAVVVKRYLNKKIHFPLYLCTIILYFALPFIISNHITQLNDDYSYTLNNHEITIYKDTKHYYGKIYDQLRGIKDDAKTGIYKDVIYVLNNKKIKTYNTLNKNQSTKKNLMAQYGSGYYKDQEGEQCIFFIEDEKCYFQKGVQMEQVDPVYVNNEMLYIEYRDEGYFVYFKNNMEIEVYSIESDAKYQLAFYLGNYFDEKEDEEITKRVQEREEKNKAIYQQRYEKYKNIIQQEDISNVQSDQDVVKITNDSMDIYEVVLDIDREITRLNNDEGATLDVQILSMLVYSKNENEYGIYIQTRADKDGESGYGYDEVILMKKYGDNYIGTRVSNEYMPSTGATNNGAYDTSQTTKFLYRVKGHEIVENGW